MYFCSLSFYCAATLLMQSQEGSLRYVLAVVMDCDLRRWLGRIDELLE